MSSFDQRKTRQWNLQPPERKIKRLRPQLRGIPSEYFVDLITISEEQLYSTARMCFHFILSLRRTRLFLRLPTRITTDSVSRDFALSSIYFHRSISNKSHVSSLFLICVLFKFIITPSVLFHLVRWRRRFIQTNSNAPSLTPSLAATR